MHEGKLRQEVVRTRVHFRPMTDAEVRAYIATGEPMDKAGSYGIQGYGAIFVDHLEGDYFSVMGLPLCALARMLAECGVSILRGEGGAGGMKKNFWSGRMKTILIAALVVAILAAVVLGLSSGASFFENVTGASCPRAFGGRRHRPAV